MRQLYREMGIVYKRMPTWSVYVLTSYELLKKFMVKSDEKRKLYNGYLRTDLYQYWGPRKPRPKKKID